MATTEELLEQLELEKIALTDNKIAKLKKGCSDCCGCDAEITAVQNNIDVVEFNDRDYLSFGSVSDIMKSKKEIPIKIITLADFESDGYTYLDSDYIGFTNYLVYLNTSGNRYLTYALDGFVRLQQGGFIIDPAKLTLEAGQELIIIAA